MNFVSSNCSSMNSFLLHCAFIVSVHFVSFSVSSFLYIGSQRTNHLDLETTEALIEAIRDFRGGVLLVSHDQHLLTSVCKELLVVENQQVKVLQGGRSNKDAFEAYKKAVVSGRR